MRPLLRTSPPQGGSFLAKMGEVMFSGIPTGAIGNHLPTHREQRVKIPMPVLGLGKLRGRIPSFGLKTLGCSGRHLVLVVFVVLVIVKVVKDWSDAFRPTTDGVKKPIYHHLFQTGVRYQNRRPC